VCELGEARQAETFEVLANEIFHGLDIVPRSRLEFGNPSDVGVTEVCRNIAQGKSLICTQCRTEETLIGEANQPLYFNVHSRTIETSFGQMLT
jgi:hypothetical protein